MELDIYKCLKVLVDSQSYYSNESLFFSPIFHSSKLLGIKGIV